MAFPAETFAVEFTSRRCDTSWQRRDEPFVVVVDDALRQSLLQFGDAGRGDL